MRYEVSASTAELVEEGAQHLSNFHGLGRDGVVVCWGEIAEVPREPQFILNL